MLAFLALIVMAIFLIYFFAYLFAGLGIGAILVGKVAEKALAVSEDTTLDPAEREADQQQRSIERAEKFGAALAKPILILIAVMLLFTGLINFAMHQERERDEEECRDRCARAGAGEDHRVLQPGGGPHDEVQHLASGRVRQLRRGSGP